MCSGKLIFGRESLTKNKLGCFIILVIQFMVVFIKKRINSAIIKFMIQWLPGFGKAC
jgi:hypothetical protein